MATCRGTPEDHCCWLSGQVCPHYNPDADPGRNCSLRGELRSWEAVADDPRYQLVRDGSRWLSAAPGRVCGDFPVSGESCATCGAEG